MSSRAATTRNSSQFKKPVVACVVGRWKAKLTRAVGHAGAMAGSGDGAEAKEKWFQQILGVDGNYTAENPIVSKAGAVVTNISLMPAALTAVMRLNGIEPDFAPEGDLELKPWFGGNQGLPLPKELDIPLVEPMQPYKDQIAELTKQVGAIFPRESMKDRSGSSIMDAKTQVTRVSGISILETAKYSLESNYCLALIREHNDANDNALFNTAAAAEITTAGNQMTMADLARQAGNAPNTVLAAACALVGPKSVDGARKAVDVLIELFGHSGLRNGDEDGFDVSKIEADARQRNALLGDAADPKAEAMLGGLKARGAKSAFIDYLRSLGGYPTADAVLAAITTSICWGALMKKKIGRNTARNFPWHVRLFATIIGASARLLKAKERLLLRRRRQGSHRQMVVDRDRLSGAPGRDAGAGETLPVPGVCWVSSSPTAPARSPRRAARARFPPMARKRPSACRSTRR